MRPVATSNRALQVAGMAVLLAGLLAAPAAGAGEGADYPRENIHDTSVGPDEALVNVSLVNSRWPDCTTLQSVVRDIFRLEGVTEKDGQAKALALWKWFRILVSSTGGGYAYEGPPGKQRIVYGPHKIFAVYGHHQCDGVSWAMAPMWRAAGYMAFDAATHGHTTVALRYRDADGIYRYHAFDPQRRIYWWDDKARRVSTRSMPVMTGMVYRHLLAPQRLHSLRTSLRIGETVERSWQNTGHIVPSATKAPYVKNRYYDYEPGKTRGIYAAVGQEVQTFAPAADGETLARQLYEGSANAACSRVGGKTLYHPARANRPGVFVFRMAPPYVVADMRFSATLHKAAAADVCRLYFSRDGGPWQMILDKKAPGAEDVKIELGREARKRGKPDVYTAYSVLLKAEFSTAGKPTDVGMSAPRLVAHRMLNKRTLPNLMGGKNYFRVSAERLAPGWALKLTVDYRLNDKPRTVERVIGKFPHYFRIDAAGAKLRKIRNWNYDQDFGNEAVRMVGYRMQLVPAGGAKLSESLPPAQAEPHFAASAPHPADMTHRRVAKKTETDPAQTSGFFPQSRKRLTDKKRMDELVRQLNNNADRSYKAWAAAQELGSYPGSVDWLCNRLDKANIDLTLFIVKALAQIGDPKATEPLLKKWQRGPAGAPGTRYIPDALAVCGKGDARVVEALVKPLRQVRFDYRFHIAHALGELGGPLAEKTLKELAEKDPFPAVREEAAAALRRLQARSK